MTWGRIAISGLGVGFVLAGAVGLVPPPWPEVESWQVALRSLFDVLAESAEGLGGLLSEGAREVISPWLTAQSVAYAVIAIGLLCGLGGVLAGERNERSAPTEPLDDPEEAVQPNLDRKARRRGRRRARTFARRGELEAAAELYWEVEEFDAAVDHFQRGGLTVRAAEVRQDQALFQEAAELLAEAEEYDRAGALFAQEEAWARAADCYEQLGRPGVAAEMQERAGNRKVAATCYEDAGFHREAARLWAETEDWDRAAACLERDLADRRIGMCDDVGGSGASQDLARQIASLHRRAGHPRQGMAALEKAGCWREAAELALEIEDDVTAARAFRLSGDPVRSAEVLERLGDQKAAARLLAEYHRDQDDLAQAAICLEDAGDHDEAGDLYRHQGAFAQAAACYSRQGGWAAAAEMFELAGDGAAAAECHERAGAFEQAAECYSRLGQSDRVAELLERAGLYLKAARAHRDAGREEGAIAALQSLTPGDETFMQGTAMLADLFCRRQQPELAVHALESAIGDAEIDRTNLIAFYGLACAFESAGQWVRCAELFEKILSLDIEFEDVEQRLVMAREQVVKQAEEVHAEEIPVSGAAGRSGRYRIRRELGRGGMGIVYEAFDTVLDRSVAFKVLPSHLTKNNQSSAPFLREAKAAAKLNHPNIVTVYDAGEQDGRYYIAMEHVDGITFKQILSRRGALAPRGMLYVALQLCDALAYAHAQRVVHRDIKPGNVMWTRDKKTKIMDFGLAKVMEEARQQTTVVAGTPYYMSPEQTLGKNVDHRTDIYALGVTLFEMLTGTVPFKEGDISYHHMHTPAPDVRQWLPAVDESIAALIARCLDKDPDSRFQTAAEMVERIREIHRG
ncbi:MAG: protein kinase [Myxococcota bacterium]